LFRLGFLLDFWIKLKVIVIGRSVISEDQVECGVLEEMQVRSMVAEMTDLVLGISAGVGDSGGFLRLEILPLAAF